MLKLKIITDKTIEMDGIESCEEITEWDDRPIDYAYSYEKNPEYRYLDIVINGEHKTLAVNGSVALKDIPVVENIIETWDKKNK